MDGCSFVTVSTLSTTKNINSAVFTLIRERTFARVIWLMCEVIWLVSHRGMSTTCLHVSLIKKYACEQESNKTLHRYIFQLWSPRFVTAVDKIVFGNIFGDRHAKLVRFSCLDLSILACRIVWCLLRRNMQLPDVHSSKECVLRRQLVQRFLSLSLSLVWISWKLTSIRIVCGFVLCEICYENYSWLEVVRRGSGSASDCVYRSWLLIHTLYGRVVGCGGVWYVEPICLNTLQRSCKKWNSFPTLGNGLWSILSFRRNCVSWSSLDVNKYSSTVSAIGWLSACNAL